MKNRLAVFVLAFTLFITFNLWLWSKSTFSVIFDQPLRSLSQLLALFGIILVSQSLVLTTRIRKLESFLGGLDTVYFFHQRMGAVSFIFLVIHPLLLVIQSLPNLIAAKTYLFPGGSLSYNLGIFALLTMITSFIFMVFVKLPYHIWKVTHKFLAVTFLLGALHSILIQSDISSYFPLKIWVGFFIISGLLSSIYTLFFFKSFGPKFLYEVIRIERVLDVMNIYLSPQTKRSLSFLPGQFVFIEFSDPSVGSEVHPFSLSSAPQDKTIRISVKISGDYTLRLPNLKQGSKAFVYGPYGAFGQLQNHAKTVWIAGGIGVAPFLSKLKSEFWDKKHDLISFYYSYPKPVEGVFSGEIKNLVQMLSNCDYHDWCSHEKKRLSAQEVCKNVKIDQVDAVLCCGPVKMMESLKKQFVELGLPEEKFMYENFSMLP